MTSNKIIKTISCIELTSDHKKLRANPTKKDTMMPENIVNEAAYSTTGVA